MAESLSYKDAGVDIDAGDALVDRLKPLARRTMRDGVLAGIGGFGALFEVPRRFREPVLVSGTDGVGTKLKLVFALERHDTIGIDLVAMSVNDILVQGAEPLFFLDYFACGKLDVDVAEQVVAGIANGCEQTGTALDIERLRQVIAEMRKQSVLISEFNELQRIVPSPVPGIFNLFLYSGNFLMGGTEDFTSLLESMLKTVRQNAAQGRAGTLSGRERARGFFSYIDHYTTDLRFWSFLERHDISHLGCILSTFWQENAPYSGDRPEAVYRVKDADLDDMIDSLALQVSRMPMVKSIRGPYDAPDMWLDDTLTMTRLLRADFVAYFGTIGCRNTWGMVKPYARDLEREGVPTLILYADAFDDRVQSWEAVIDRMQEFLVLRRIGAGRTA